MATTTLTGTTGNDILNAPGSVSTLVQGLQGNDTISLTLANDEAAAGAGNDRIRISRTGVLANTINGGDGNDTVVINSAGQFNGYVDLGAGADVISFSQTNPLINGGQIFGNQGADTIALSNQLVNAVVGAGSGNDVLTFSAGTIASTLINGGVNKDSITFDAGVITFTTVAGGKGDDTITFTGQAAAYTNASVGGGQGSDSINVNNFVTGTIAGGGLNDTIRFNGNIQASSVIYGDGAGVTTEGTGTEGAADGNDLIISTQGNTAGLRVSIYGAGGNDTIAFTQGFGAQSSNQIVDGGKGADSIVWGAPSLGGTVFGGDGADTINYAGSNTIQGSAGGFEVVTLSGGAGTDLIRLGVVNSQGLQAGDAAGAAALNASDYYVVLSGVSGDTVRALTGMTFTAGGSNTSVNWAGNAPTIFAASNNLFTGQYTSGGFVNSGNNGGSIAVFSDGTDSVIGIYSGGTVSLWNRILVKGVDLTVTTAVGEVVATATAFRFSISANTGGGVNITFA